MKEPRLPWYRRTLRWAQTNITEIDPVRYDIAWWRGHWRRTRVQGVIINAGGIVVYYPSKFELSHRAEFLGERDLYGELVEAARAEGLTVLARMDSNRVDERFYVEHPDWMARDEQGRPYRAGELYVTCINSPYYDEYLPGVLAEIIERSRPDGFGDNSYSGLDRDHACHCENCRKRFKDAAGYAIPRAKDWDSPAWRAWIAWNYRRRLEIWDLNNAVTRAAGGPDCLWIGMNSGDIMSQCVRFRDYKAVCERSELVLLDQQSRKADTGFQHNAEFGRLLYDLLPSAALVTESMAQYQHSYPVFRVASAPAEEARHWMRSGFAGGIQPWWHHIGAYHDDRRQYATAEPLMVFHAENERYLVNRTPVAPVALLWSQTNVDFYGRDDARTLTQLPWQGAATALRRARIPFIPVHVDNLARHAGDIRVAVLAGLGAVSDAQAAALRSFVERGGGLVAGPESTLYDEWGDARPDFALADILGARRLGAAHGSIQPSASNFEDWNRHSYLRLTPELRAAVYGPLVGDEPPADGKRHPVLDGLENTDILPFGGRLEVVRAEEGAIVPLSYVPHFPIYPPETSWMRTPSSALPALVLKEQPAGGRTAYLAADLDRCYGRGNHPDHGRILANLAAWALRGELPIEIDGMGFIDCNLYRQEGRLILHVLNLASEGAWKPPLHEIVPAGPFTVRVRPLQGMRAPKARLLVLDTDLPIEIANGWLSVKLERIEAHEVLVIE